MIVRPLRSVLIGDVDYYPSEYAFGVNQAMTKAGHYHTSVNIRWDMGVIAKRVREMQPDIIWGHMLLWAPGENKTVDLLMFCEQLKQKGVKILLHDGDARSETRFPTDISPAIDLALCNHKADRSIWKIPQLHWPYFAFDQDRIAVPTQAFRCKLAFAGRLDPSGIYQARTNLVVQLLSDLASSMLIFPSDEVPYTLFRTPELAASADAILGFGRPERNGWLDVRVFQYPGAGGVLLHDDVGGMLEPYKHYVPYNSLNVDSIHSALIWIQERPIQVAKIRGNAFEYVQINHSATARVRQALQAVGLTL